jgi:hypothetical protein
MNPTTVGEDAAATVAGEAMASSRSAIAPDRRLVALWDVVGGISIFLVGSFLHFAYELSGFAVIVAPFGSVNESTWEHLKLFYWPGVAFAVVQHAYLRHQVNNFWLAKAASLWITTIGVALAFYCYLGIVLPINGKGDLAGTLVTAVIGIGLGQAASFALLTGHPRTPWTRIAGIGLIISLGAAMVLFTFATPRIFLFENFYGYVYTGEFGILEDYTPYLIFR